MERLTYKNELGQFPEMFEHNYSEGDWDIDDPELLGGIVERLSEIEDILGDDYDLDRLRELVQADREGRCVVLPVKPGGMVRFARNPRAKHETVDAITIYPDGKMRFGFHEYGVGVNCSWSKLRDLSSIGK